MIIISLLMGVLLAIVIGFFTIPLLKNCNCRQNVSRSINIRHLCKNGTPTMGGIIFLFPTVILLLILTLTGKMAFNYSISLVLLTLILYGTLGFADDYKKVREQNNKGLSIFTKLIFECIIAIIIFFFYSIFINNTIITIGNFSINLKYTYGFIIFSYLIFFSNAVNITDGLDGLAAGLSLMCFLTLGLICLKLSSYDEIAIFCFVISGSLIGFLYYNFYPAKVFMGDLGSLSLGALLAIVTIIIKKELLIITLGFCFIFEFFSSLFQIISIKCFNHKIFLKSPFHHHLEEKGYHEVSIIKLFYLCNLIINVIVLLNF